MNEPTHHRWPIWPTMIKRRTYYLLLIFRVMRVRGQPELWISRLLHYLHWVVQCNNEDLVGGGRIKCPASHRLAMFTNQTEGRWIKYETCAECYYASKEEGGEKKDPHVHSAIIIMISKTVSNWWWRELKVRKHRWVSVLFLEMESERSSSSF